MYLLTDILQEWIGVEKEESSVPLTSFQKEEKEEDEDEQLLHKINEQIRNIYQVIRHSLSPKEEEEDNDESPVPEASYSLSMEADKRPALFSDVFVHLAGDEVYSFQLVLFCRSIRSVGKIHLPLSSGWSRTSSPNHRDTFISMTNFIAYLDFLSKNPLDCGENPS